MSTASTSASAVAVVVLNWNGWRDTLECLDALARVETPGADVIVVDNGSDDDSWERLHARAGARVTMLRNDRNLGFARGNNVGIRHALAAGYRVIGLLNNDVLVTPGFLDPLVTALERDPTAGVVGPRVLHPIDRTPTERPLRRRPGFLDILLMLLAYNAARFPDSSALVGHLFSRATAPEPVYALPGSCLFFPAHALQRIGLLDEHTFLYFEELIASERLARAGLRCVFVPASVVHHKRGQSTARLGARSFAEGSRSQRYYLSTYLGLPAWQWRLLDLIRAGVYVARSVTDASYRAGLGAYLREVWR